VIGSVDGDLQRHLRVGYTDVDALLRLSLTSDRSPRMAALARAVSRRPSALTRLVDRLERRGLLQRIRHTPTDVSVSLTECGLDLLGQASPRILVTVEDRFWSRLTPDERRTRTEICRKLLEDPAPRC